MEPVIRIHVEEQARCQREDPFTLPTIAAHRDFTILVAA
jgi:hypothetical protein